MVSKGHSISSQDLEDANETDEKLDHSPMAQLHAIPPYAARLQSRLQMSILPAIGGHGWSPSSGPSSGPACVCVGLAAVWVDVVECVYDDVDGPVCV